MHPEKLKRALAQLGDERFDYLVRKVADFEEIWCLANEGWASCADDSGQVAVPMWSEADFAAVCATGDWEGMRPKPIELVDFLDNWVPGMMRDNCMVAVFPTPSGRGVLVEASHLGEALEEEKKQYE
ncbi:MAG: DUF2750 domain-containing protein [bacterium]|nr:DUF2750 domain-containing protein [bacterium]